MNDSTTRTYEPEVMDSVMNKAWRNRIANSDELRELFEGIVDAAHEHAGEASSYASPIEHAMAVAMCIFATRCSENLASTRQTRTRSQKTSLDG